MIAGVLSPVSFLTKQDSKTSLETFDKQHIVIVFFGFASRRAMFAFVEGTLGRLGGFGATQKNAVLAEATKMWFPSLSWKFCERTEIVFLV